jgi:predicted transcriptional regulator
MSGRSIRNLVLLAALAGLAYWVYEKRPTVPGVVDAVTKPLMGSKAAVDASERNRVVGEASEVIIEQQDAKIGRLHEGMTRSDVRELLGDPDRVETKKNEEGVEEIRWIYNEARRVLVFREGRVVSIVVL